MLLLGLDDGVSSESEISAETSFVYSVGSVLGSKQFFDLCLGYPIFWYPIVAPEPRAGVWDTLPEVFSRLLFLSGSCRVCFILAILVGARERTRRV